MQADLLHALEAITSQADVLLDLREPVLEGLVPALALAIRGEWESGDARFLCLKLLCDITLPFLLPEGQDTAGDDSGGDITPVSGNVHLLRLPSMRNWMVICHRQHVKDSKMLSSPVIIG